jgi:DNA-3-methyladenine glycosylase II
MTISVHQPAVDYLITTDPILAMIIEKAGLPTFAANTNYYEALVGSIISQQLSVKAAATIEKRFVDLFDGDGFPTPDQILTKSIEELRAIGLSRQKASYIQDLAMKVLDGSVQFDHLDKLTNEEIITELTAVKGIGVWTVHMFLIFCMGRSDVLPIGDLGIKNGIRKLYELDAQPTPEDITALALKNKWHPYESVASWYIWHSLDNKPAL